MLMFKKCCAQSGSKCNLVFFIYELIIFLRSLERMNSEEEQKQRSHSNNLSCRMALVDQWKAKKREDHKEIMKRARKAADLRQVIMYVKNVSKIY